MVRNRHIFARKSYFCWAGLVQKRGLAPARTALEHSLDRKEVACGESVVIRFRSIGKIKNGAGINDILVLLARLIFMQHVESIV